MICAEQGGGEGGKCIQAAIQVDRGDARLGGGGGANLCRVPRAWARIGR